MVKSKKHRRSKKKELVVKKPSLKKKINKIKYTRKQRKKTPGHTIYVLYTGGTIGMEHDDSKGLIPVRGVFKKLVNDLKLTHSLRISYTIESTQSIIDSSNLKSENWKNILKKLQDNYHKYDTFIVVHGTDTLAYTSSLLSFFCRHWKKGIVITGSQIPMYEFRNDANKNIKDSIIMSLYRIPQVIIVFGGLVLRGNCTTKYSSVSFKAYESPNTHNLGNFGVNLYLNAAEIKKSIIPNVGRMEKYLPKKFDLTKWNPIINIYTLTLTPGMKFSQVVDSIFSAKLPNAIIIRSYGIGNAPISSNDFYNFLKQTFDKGIVVVNTTQCVSGGVNMHYYRTGRKMLEHNVISTKKMTFESIYTKLFYLFQVVGVNNPELVKKLFKINLSGELVKEIPFNKNIKRSFKNYQEL